MTVDVMPGLQALDEQQLPQRKKNKLLSQLNAVQSNNMIHVGAYENDLHEIGIFGTETPQLVAGCVLSNFLLFFVKNTGKQMLMRLPGSYKRKRLLKVVGTIPDVDFAYSVVTKSLYVILNYDNFPTTLAEVFLWVDDECNMSLKAFVD